MSKLIAVCGSPCSGKTTFSLKIAQEIYGMKKTSVMFISPDTSVPAMAYLFPNGKDSELYSLGAVIDKTDIYTEDIMKQTVNVKTMQNFGFLGFKLGENRYSYPRPTEDKVTRLFNVLKDSAEYVICDCTCDHDDLVSSVAKRDCSIALQLFVPDMKCISYYASCVSQFLTIEEKKLKVLNIMERDIYLPIDETMAHFHGMDFMLPYERNLKQQLITGTVSERLPHGKYRDVVAAIAREGM